MREQTIDNYYNQLRIAELTPALCIYIQYRCNAFLLQELQDTLQFMVIEYVCIKREKVC